MNKMVFFNRLKKAIKELPLDEQKYIIKEYEFRYEQEKKNGLKEREIIALFGEPESIINSYFLSKNDSANINMNNDDIAKNRGVNTNNEVEVHASLDIVLPPVDTDSDDSKITTEESLGVDTIDSSENNNQTNEEVKEKKEYKKITPSLLPLWLLLILIVFVISLTVSILYIPLFFLGGLTVVYGLYMIAGSVFHFLSSNIFGGLFQLGVAILVMVLGVVFICLVNVLVKSLWKGLIIMFKKIGGKKDEKKI